MLHLKYHAIIPCSMQSLFVMLLFCMCPSTLTRWRGTTFLLLKMHCMVLPTLPDRHARLIFFSDHTFHALISFYLMLVKIKQLREQSIFPVVSFLCFLSLLLTLHSPKRLSSPTPFLTDVSPSKVSLRLTAALGLGLLLWLTATSCLLDTGLDHDQTYQCSNH